MMATEPAASSPVVIRPAGADDAGLVLETWLKSFRRGGRAPKVSSTVYWNEHRRLVAQLLERSVVFIACNPNDSSQVFGWCAAEGRAGVAVIHYLYVKLPFRRFGVAKELLRVATRGATGIHHTHETSEGLELAKKLESTFNPYLTGVAL